MKCPKCNKELKQINGEVKIAINLPESQENQSPKENKTTSEKSHAVIISNSPEDTQSQEKDLEEIENE